MPPRKPTGHGGWRPGAGRPRKPGSVSHLARPSFSSRSKLTVTLRFAAGVPSLRRHARVIAAVLDEAAGPDFRVRDHELVPGKLELTVEAADTLTLSKAMQGLSIRLARRLNALLDRKGSLWATRYEAKVVSKR